MGSRKEEERNEKIIRGLMKLPPNRRCINCNSLGPQYVCTNFWTFVCMTCSGIHLYPCLSLPPKKLKHFKMVVISNVNKVRDFIKNGLGSHLDESRRASSYHSYSQSPPYDYQYEDRRYGKLGAVLTRKPGSDRGHYVGKISSLVHSPGRMSEQMFEDRFANEGSCSRISDYSVSSGGDPFRSGAQSPNFEKDAGFNSPPVQPSRDVSSLKANFKRDVDGIPHPKRTTSLGSMGSFDSNSVSLKSCNSGGLADVSEHDQAAGAPLDKISTFPQSHGPVNYGGLDLFEAPVVTETVPSTAPPIDLFQLPETSAASITEQPSTAILNRNPQELSIPKNEGWATFDTPSSGASIPGTESLSHATVPANEGSSVKSDQFPSSNTSMQWPAFQNSGANGPSPSSDPWSGNLHIVQAPAVATSAQVVSAASDPWPGNLHNGEAPAIATNMQSWNAFDDFTSHLPSEGFKPNSEPHVDAYMPSPTPDQYLAIVSQHETNDDGNPRVASHDGPPNMTVPSQADMGPSYNPSMFPLMGQMRTHATEHKSTNPFDFPCDSDLEQNNMFLDMSSLQAALPNSELPSPFLGGATQSWFPQNPVSPFVQAAAQGGLAYMSGQSPSAQLANIPTQEPVASVGGNPFA
ncbi:hypothetical protein CUMW_128830 [Citrus unshiu]|nr:hypothetical protein CUMW_128830 [Citrus unshiu]